MKIRGNTIFIAGGTSGIGLGLAVRFAGAGNTVIVSGRRRELLTQIAADHPGIETLVLDVTDEASIGQVADAVKTTYPDTNVLINMAGIMATEDLHTADFLATAEATVTTNILGPLRLIAAFTEFLAAKDDAVIINVSSGLAFVPLVATPTYCATKAFIHSLSESMRVQLADTGIQVIELAPPAVQTALMGQEDAEFAMPLDDFLTEAIGLLDSEPAIKEILVDRVKPLRFAAVNGNYDDMLNMLAHSLD